MSRKLIPIKNSPRHDGNQCMDGSLVHPNKKKPIGKVILPITLAIQSDPSKHTSGGGMHSHALIGGNRFSGSALPPCLSTLAAKMVVEYQMSALCSAVLFYTAYCKDVLIAAAKKVPSMTARNGSEPTRLFQPRFSWNIIGTAEKRRSVRSESNEDERESGIS